jgi:TRAP-type C4-dicarboxylate transport system substrate-binding protein
MLLLTLVVASVPLTPALGSASAPEALAAGGITLTMQSPDGQTSDTVYFAQEVAYLTKDKLRIAIGNAYPSGNPNNELRLAVALREGKVAMGYLATRDWERDGSRVLDFRALQAPFLINSYPLLDAVAKSSIATQLLASLSRNNIVGLGLVPESLRRILSTEPLVTLAEFKNARIRILPNPTSMLIFRALDAVPVTNLTADQTGTQLTGGKLNGIESDGASINDDGYVGPGKTFYLSSNVVPFPKVYTIAIAKPAFESLSPADRAALQAAAAATVAHADPASQEASAMTQICAAGILKVDTATTPDLAAMQSATAPVDTLLEEDPATKQAIVEIEQLKTNHYANDQSTITPCNQPKS